MKKTKEKKETRKSFHHLGSPEFYGDVEYSKDNVEYSILLNANNSNKHFIGDQIQMDDTLQLGMDEKSFEALIQTGIGAIVDRLKDKLKMYNDFQKVYYTQELLGNEKEFEKSDWNAFKK